jgi:hypothetical protein
MPLIIIISVVYYQKGLVLLNAKVILTVLNDQNRACYEGGGQPIFFVVCSFVVATTGTA